VYFLNDFAIIKSHKYDRNMTENKGFTDFG